MRKYRGNIPRWLAQNIKTCQFSKSFSNGMFFNDETRLPRKRFTNTTTHIGDERDMNVLIQHSKLYNTSTLHSTTSNDYPV